MEIILRKFDMNAYTTRRIKELKGEKIYAPDTDDAIMRYARRRMREIHQSEETKLRLDSSLLGCYTVSTMGDRDGET